MGIPNSNRGRGAAADGSNRGRRQKDIANALLGVVEPAEIEEDDDEQTPATFDPGEHTVADVLAYVAEYPDSRAGVLDAEKAGKNRVTLVEQLEQTPS